MRKVIQLNYRKFIMAYASENCAMQLTAHAKRNLEEIRYLKSIGKQCHATNYAKTSEIAIVPRYILLNDCGSIIHDDKV
jgi:hypothetical protein